VIAATTLARRNASSVVQSLVPCDRCPSLLYPVGVGRMSFQLRCSERPKRASTWWILCKPQALYVRLQPRIRIQRDTKLRVSEQRMHQ
jgi:hypothetical protein